MLIAPIIHMSLMSIAFEAAIIIISAVVASGLSYLIFKSKEAMIWAYVSAFIPRAFVVILVLLQATNLTIFTWFSHTAGIFIYPMLLTMGNILLIEVSLVKKVKRKSSIPISEKQAVRIENFLSRLQEKKLLPKAVTIKQVYLSGVLAGIVNLAFVIAFGLM